VRIKGKKVKKIFFILSVSFLLNNTAFADDVSIKVENLINCKSDIDDYTDFAYNLSDETIGFKSYNWVQEDSGTPFFNQYRLPKPINISGFDASTVILSGSGIFAILSDVDAAKVAQTEGIKNSIPSKADLVKSLGLTAEQAKEIPENNLFSGQKIIKDVVIKEKDIGRVHTTITRHIENKAAFPNKTLVGCTYSIDMPDL